MFTLPQLLEEDLQQIDGFLRELLKKTDARVALLVDQGGFLITQAGEPGHFDLTTIAALSSGAYAATQTIAGLVDEPSFNCVYQQGDKHSVFMVSVDSQCQLIVVFESRVGVGVVKYYASSYAPKVAGQLEVARVRDPDHGVDLSVLNMADPSAVFRRQ
jgi:predicted regulator of Ras-like GTPase activity (Roadblock/LC7/MglB family)